MNAVRIKWMKWLTYQEENTSDCEPTENEIGSVGLFGEILSLSCCQGDESGDRCGEWIVTKDGKFGLVHTSRRGMITTTTLERWYSSLDGLCVRFTAMVQAIRDNGLVKT